MTSVLNLSLFWVTIVRATCVSSVPAGGVSDDAAAPPTKLAAVEEDDAHNAAAAWPFPQSWSFASMASLPCFTCDDEALALLSDDNFWKGGSGGGVFSPDATLDVPPPAPPPQGVDKQQQQRAGLVVRTRRCKAHPPTSAAEVDRRQVKVRAPRAGFHAWRAHIHITTEGQMNAPQRTYVADRACRMPHARA
jgi:hypothetical protein